MRVEGQEQLSRDVFSLVEDAVTFAVCKQIEPDMRGLFVNRDNSWETLLEEATRRGCGVASLEVIRYLSREAGEWIVESLIISSKTDSANGWQFKENWVWHSYFLAKGIDGMWYAGSPANYKRGEEESRLTRIIVDHDLNEVMKQIEDIEGGCWPNAMEIEMKLSSRVGLGKVSIDKGAMGERISYGEIFYEDGYIESQRYEKVLD